MANQKPKPTAERSIEATMVLTETKTTGQELFTREEEQAIDTPEFADRYRNVCKVAAGGVGVISKAKDVVFDRIVAVKALNEKFQDDGASIRYFWKESRLNAQLDHPSIVPVYAMGKNHAGKWECVMKFINGTSLSGFLGKLRTQYDAAHVSAGHERSALNSRLEYFVKICEAVEYCHNRKVVHGDIKPDNIMMGKFGEVYLMDWGCARETGSVEERLCGTPNYMPPEFFSTKTVTAGNDIYALGMVLFELTTLRPGKQVCSGAQSGDCSCRLVYNADAYTHYKSGVKVNSRIRAIIMKALNPDPAERYQTASELTDDVRRYMFDDAISAAPDTLWQKIARSIYRNRKLSAGIAACLIAVFCGLLFAGYYREVRQDARHSDALIRRLRLQAYTDILANAVDKKYTAAKIRLLLFSGGLTNSATIGKAGFQALCSEILRCDFSDFRYHPENKVDTIPGNSPVCGFASVRGGTVLSLAGHIPEKVVQDAVSALKRSGKSHIWIPVSHASDGTLTTVCATEIPGGQGTAILEFRMSKQLEPLVRANLADPVHELFLLTDGDRVVRINGGDLCPLGAQSCAKTKLSSDELLEVVKLLRKNNMQQIIVPLKGEPYYVSASPVPAANGVLVQMISAAAMENHNHVVAF